LALNIILTNDDGYTSPGLQTLYRALVAHGDDVHIVAPAANQSAQGSSLGGLASLEQPVTYREVTPSNYAVEGRPVAASLVALDVLDLFDGEKPDLVISGSNRGDNSGQSNNISGTVNAAVAALHEGVPAIALSAGPEGGSYDAAYQNAANFLVNLLDRLEAGQAEGTPLLPGGEGLSIEIPGKADLSGLAVTRIDQESSASYPIRQLDSSLFNSAFTPNTDPSGNPLSEGAQFLAGNLTVSPIDGDWSAPDAIRLDLAQRLDSRLGDGTVPEERALHIMLVDEAGADAPGLQALRDTLLAEGHEVTVVAPANDQAGTGTALTLSDFAVTETAQGYTVAATPTTTVYAALDTLLTGSERPDLVISGIDAGPSLGLQATGSATLAAAVASVFNYSVPAIAVSAAEDGGGQVPDSLYQTGAAFIAELVAELQATAGKGGLLPDGVGLNVNLPLGAEASDIAFTRFDASTDAELKAVADGSGAARLVYDGRVSTADPAGEGNAFQAGAITITPFDANYGSDDLASYDRIAELLDAEFGVPGSPAPIEPPTEIDWNALAARVTANFEATGQWFL
jgi:5'/3'-nucleotidase SurE